MSLLFLVIVANDPTGVVYELIDKSYNRLLIRTAILPEVETCDTQSLVSETDDIVNINQPHKCIPKTAIKNNIIIFCVYKYSNK
mgnify:FL=1